MKKLILSLSALVILGVLACDERTPTSTSDALLPVLPTTVEIHLSWDQFATGYDVFGGFGRTSDLGGGVLANAFRGLLHARTLGRWDLLDPTVQVPDSSGVLVEDPNPRLAGGRVVVLFDSTGARPPGPVTVSVHRTLTQWDVFTATWEKAADSLNASRPWPVAGGGPAVEVARGVWDAAQGDSVVIAVDSFAVRAWIDTASVQRGFRVDLETPDTQVDVTTVSFRYDIVPSLKRDSTIVRTVDPTALTFIYTPLPGPPTRGLRVGGVPAWRSVIRTQIPTVLTGPPEVCALLGCPFELRPERINHASLVLQTRPSDPAAFQPQDTVFVDVRAVLAPEKLPKAPLGPAIAGVRGRDISPAAFNTPQAVTIPITSFVQAQLGEPQAGELPAPRALALLSFLEPASIGFAAFAGPGETGAPFLRLIVTSSPVVQLP